ncbi:BamA/TamA family outer membrane protein [Rubrivirga sp. IMCC45206]|uniref:BamA/TamA family outer membrane protein n=1 Tax=Rubrivirga sp. IMCC45206 TaxID=3391614 RepID=UPI00398FB674
MQTQPTGGADRKVALAIAVLALAATGAAQTVAVAADTTLRLAAPVADVADALAAQGYLVARVDSARADTAFVTLGERAVVRRFEVVGAASVPLTWTVEAGAPFSSARLAADLDAAAARYASAGFGDARLVPAVEAADGGRAVDVTVQVTEGAPGEVVGVELAGARSPARAFASRRAGLTEPTPLAAVDLDALRQRLDATGLYAEVGVPVVARDAAGDLVVQVPVVDAPPGAVDVVLGYLPPGPSGSGSVVGRGRVDLRNPFGGGRALSVELERTPGLASSFRVAASDPFVLGTPIGAGLAFDGDARDSTFARQRLAGSLIYAVDPGLDLVASVAGEQVRPGTYGAGLVDGRPRVRRTDDVLFGLGVVLRRLDRARNPRRGVEASVFAEQARRASETFEAPGGRRRLTVRGRGYVPTLARQTLVLGLDATVTQQATGPDGLVDEGDLVRVGGAARFRGYDEDAFLARSYVRGIAEYRVLFDAASFAFAFVDAGGLDRPAVPGFAAERRGLLGYGAGLRVTTALGLATVSYALNPDLGIGRGKVHVGLAVGL